MKEGLLGVRTFVIPRSILMETIFFLREVGVEGFEGFVLWAGELLDPQTLRFSATLVPDQNATMTENGLLVRVDGKALFEINKSVHARNAILAAQVHSHPTEAYHSSTDDAYPLVTLMGSLSVVVPDFARNAPSDLPFWAWYRLSKRGRWLPVGKQTKLHVE